MKRLIFSLLFLLLVGLSASAQQGSRPRLAGEPDRKELLQMIDSCIKAENQIQCKGRRSLKDFSPIFWFGMGLITSQLIVIVRNVALHIEGDE